MGFQMGRPKNMLVSDLTSDTVRTTRTERKTKLNGVEQIDRLSAEPFYLQLSRMVERAIDAGELVAGDRLPNESELCRRYDLARSTVRETLRNLHERGRIKLIPRRGAFVVNANQKGWGLQVTAGFFEGEADHNKRRVETQVLEAGSIALPELAATSLGLEPGAMGFRLRRLRKLDGVLALYSENFMPAAFEPLVMNSEVMEVRGSLNRVLRAAGYKIFGARRSVEAIAAPAQVAKLLEIPARSPLLLITSVSWGKDRRPFDFYRSFVRTDVVNITVEAQAAEEDS
jgi:GntR family transcriptional regulator